MNAELIKDSLKEKCIAVLPELRTACGNYVLCRAYEEVVVEKAKEIYQRVLNENEYFVSAVKAEELNEAARQGGHTERIQEVERITDEFDTYLMSEDDAKKYYQQCYEYFLEAGIANDKGAGYIPEEKARDERFAAEKEVLNIMEKVTADIFSAEDFMHIRRNVNYKKRILEIALSIAEIGDSEEAEQ